jgi:DNA replication and repair protein RecF
VLSVPVVPREARRVQGTAIVRVESVEIRGLRCLQSAQLAFPASGAWLVGPNGAGKTSVLEALCLLGFGRSFRGRVVDGLVQRGETALEVVARWSDDRGRSRISGLRHSGDRWEARLDGESVASLSELAAPFPVLCFHPESSAVVTGPAEERRRALDWLAFHVEPRFADAARRYGRALKQRNALLRLGAPDVEFEPWEREMGLMAEAVASERQNALALWQPGLAVVWSALVSGFPVPALQLRPGWRRGEASLADLLLLNRARDRELGYTTIGPQRADIDLGQPFGVEAEQLSRGQAKLVALAMVLSQAEALRHWSGERSLLLLDDLQAELDPMRQAAVLDWVREAGCQTLVTGTRWDEALAQGAPGWSVFHVEQGGRIAEASAE